MNALPSFFLHLSAKPTPSARTDTAGTVSSGSTMIHCELSERPSGSVANKVDVRPIAKGGRIVLRIALDAASRAGKPGVDLGGRRSIKKKTETVVDATIEVDVCARLLPDAPDYARGFIGLADRVRPDLSAYESVYIRPTNGTLHAPGPPRDHRAVQYYAYPDWPFDVLRDREPGRYEAGADIGTEGFFSNMTVLARAG